jgi:GrpB-like predicted nucleotidyltransferase (UPF0157 family)
MALQIADYDPTWPRAFTEQRNLLTIALQRWLGGPIEHVGSTAVPGLATKPIIDVVAPVTSLAEAHRAVPVLDQAGWLLWPSDPNSSWRLWFLRPRPEARTHHLYLIEHDDPHLDELIAFRDRLRAHADLREQYATLKRRLAEAHRDDREAYTEAKRDFVASALQAAGIELLPRAAPGQ